MTDIIRKYSLFLALFCAFLSTADPLRACSVCGCGDPLQSVSDVAPMAGSFRLGLDGEYLTMKAAGEDPGSTESLTQKTFTAVLGYSPTKDLSLTLFLPMVGKDGKVEGGGNPTETSSNLGLGDLNLAARFFFLQDEDFKAMTRTALALTVGSYLPTGNNDLQDEGARIDEHDQLGTGGWGPFCGLYYSTGGEMWDLTTTATSVFHTVNGFGYRYGNALRGGVQGKFKPSDKFAFSLSMDGRYADADQESGSNAENTGGSVAEITPGIWWSPAESLGVYAKAHLPIVTELFGEQTVGATVQIGTQLILN